MSDEQKIPDVPELRKALQNLANEARGIMGLSESELRKLVGSTNVACLRDRICEAESILARVPKPKGMVVVAECDVPDGACTGVYPRVTMEFDMQDDSRVVVDRYIARYEEREV